MFCTILWTCFERKPPLTDAAQESCVRARCYKKNPVAFLASCSKTLRLPVEISRCFFSYKFNHIWSLSIPRNVRLCFLVILQHANALCFPGRVRPSQINNLCESLTYMSASVSFKCWCYVYPMLKNMPQSFILITKREYGHAVIKAISFVKQAVISNRTTL